MAISRHDDWIQIAELDPADQIRFTAEFQALVGDLGWEAKAFVGHLLGLWYDPFEHMLDYGKKFPLPCRFFPDRRISHERPGKPKPQR